MTFDHADVPDDWDDVDTGPPERSTSARIDPHPRGGAIIRDGVVYLFCDTVAADVVDDVDLDVNDPVPR